MEKYGLTRTAKQIQDRWKTLAKQKCHSAYDYVSQFDAKHVHTCNIRNSLLKQISPVSLLKMDKFLCI